MRPPRVVLNVRRLTQRSRPLGVLVFAIAATAIATPQARATHLPGFGHDNNITLPAIGTGTTCSSTDGCVIAETLGGGSASGLIGRSKATGPGFAMPTAGVRGENFATSGAGYGVYGSEAGGGYGIYGTTPSGTGAYGISSTGYGVQGLHTSSTGTDAGVYGYSGSQAANAAAVRGEITSVGSYSSGVWGRNTASGFGGFGVYGEHAGTGIGVYGEALNGFAVSGFSPNNWSGYFQGSVNVVGTLYKSSGAFRIDHPLDPAHKYLQHSFVESPDMMNVYNGNVTTNGKGFATVKLPDWFQALNKDFRYQLTSLGGLQDVAVAKEIAHNRFTIQSEKRNSKVSWQVTGIRKDHYANAHRIQVVVPKGSAENKYVHPELYGKPLSKSVVVLPGMTTRTHSQLIAPTRSTQK